MAFNFFQKSTYVDLKAITDISTTVLAGVTSTTNVADITNMTQIVDTTGLDITCKGKLDFQLSQQVDSNVIVLSDIKSQDKIELENKIMNALKTELETKMTQQNTAYGIGANVGSDYTQISNLISTKLNSLIDLSIKQSVSVVKQNQIIQQVKLSGKINVGGDCNFRINQSFMSKIVAQNITDKITDVLVSNNITNDMLAKYKLTLDQANTGFDLAKIFGMIAVIIVGIILLAIIGFVLKSSFSKSDKTKGLDDLKNKSGILEQAQKTISSTKSNKFRYRFK